MKKTLICFLFLALVFTIFSKNLALPRESIADAKEVVYKIYHSGDKGPIWMESHRDINPAEIDKIYPGGKIALPSIEEGEYYLEVLVDGEPFGGRIPFTSREELDGMIMESRGLRREADPEDGGEILETEAIGLTLQGPAGAGISENTLIRNSLGIGYDSGDPLSQLDVRGGHARFWSGSATPGYANIAGDVFIENELEVDGTIYGASWRDASGNDMLFGGTGISVAEDGNGQWTITNTEPSSGGTVTSIATSSPITGGTITTTGTIGIQQEGDIIGGTDITVTGGTNILPGDDAADVTIDFTGSTDDGDWQVSGSDMYSLPTGDVGIGTTSPAEKLHVSGNLRVDGDGTTSNIITSDRLAIGLGASVGATRALALGRNAQASSQEAIALGYNASATNTRALALGYNADVSGYDATAIGRGAIASGLRSQAFGAGSSAGHTEATVIGYNAASTKDRHIVIGSGSVGEVYMPGELGIGTTSPASELDVNGTIRADHYRANDGTDLINAGTDIAVTEEADGSWTIDAAGGGGGDQIWTFDSDLEDWTATTACGYTTNWAWDSDGGAGAAYFDQPYGNSSAYLLSPSVDVAGATTVTLSYDHRYYTESCCDHGYVAYRIDGGSWTLFTPTTGSYDGSDGQYHDALLGSCGTNTHLLYYGSSTSYETHSGDIDVTGASTLEIAFHYSSDGSIERDGWWINEVSLTGLPESSVSMDDLTDTDLTSPAEGDLLYYDGTNWVNLGIGADGEVLTSDGTIPGWAPSTGGSGSSSYMFTHCGQTGRTGPSQAQADAEYAGTSLEGEVTVTDGIQYWTVPAGVSEIEIEACGAQGGGSEGGLGAEMVGTFTVSPGEVLKILVGQQGMINGRLTSGGGGSYVTRSDDTPLIVAGGGGGADDSGSNQDGTTATAGQDGYASYSDATGGTGGDGGNSTGGTGHGGGGGGFYSDGSGSSYGYGFLNGGYGGNPTTTSYPTVDGGFGGGGGAVDNDGGSGYWGGGAGGGWSGGGAACASGTGAIHRAGGGGSYNAGTAQANAAGSNSGHGYVAISTDGGGTTPPSCSDINESFETDFGEWDNVTGDDDDWTRNSGGTGSSNTGPSSASDGTYYIYCETSSPRTNGDQFYLQSDQTLCSSPSIEFDYHMYFNDYTAGSLQLQVSNTDGASWSTIWTETGDQGTAWQNTTRDLSSFAGEDVIIRFVFTIGSGTSYYYDCALDDITIYDVDDGGTLFRRRLDVSGESSGSGSGATHMELSEPEIIGLECSADAREGILLAMADDGSGLLVPARPESKTIIGVASSNTIKRPDRKAIKNDSEHKRLEKQLEKLSHDNNNNEKTQNIDSELVKIEDKYSRYFIELDKDREVYLLADANNMAIKKGDLLTLSDEDGIVKKLDNNDSGKIIAIALEGLESGEKTIKAMLSEGYNAPDYEKEIDDLNKRLEKLEEKIK